MAQKRQSQDVDPGCHAGNDKRQCVALDSGIQEAVRIPKFWVMLEPMLRRVVSEEVERAIAKYLPSSKLGLRLPSRPHEGSGPTSLRLQFQNKVALPLYTGCKIEGEEGNAIRVCLQDANTGEVIVMDEEPSIKLEVVVLEGDFSNDDDDDWTFEDFENHVVKEREGKRPLLTGDLSLSLKDGVGTLGELVFTDNSSWIRSRKFRLGVRIATGCLTPLRVREAKTEAFFVKDHRGQLYKKHYPPNLSDDVWRLEKIGKDGAYHKRLCEYGVNTVEDFLVMYSTGPLRLREIFGTTMSTKTWDSIIEHAKTCILNETQYVYYHDESHSIGVILNAIYQPLGIVRDGSYVPASSLSDTEQVYVDRLVQEAHCDLTNVCKLPARSNYQEHDSAKRSGPFGKDFKGSAFREVSEKQRVPGQSISKAFHGSVAPTLRSSGLLANENACENVPSMVGVVMKQPPFFDAYSPGTLESLVANGSHCCREVESIADERAFYQPDMKLIDEFHQGRTLGPWGADELVLLSSVNRGGSVISGDLECPFPSLFKVQSYDVDRGGSLHRRACIGWIKLKAVLKCSYFVKKAMASRRGVMIEQLD